MNKWICAALILFICSVGFSQKIHKKSKYKSSHNYHISDTKELSNGTLLTLGGSVLFTAGFIGNRHNGVSPYNGPRTIIPGNPHQMAMFLGGAVTITGLITLIAEK